MMIDGKDMQSAGAQQADQLPVELRAVAETVADGGGFWTPCTGCYDTEDGRPTQKYAHSDVFGCELGNGCRECGGLGAVWDDTDYAAMAEFMEQPDAAPALSEQQAEPIGGWAHALEEAERESLSMRYQRDAAIQRAEAAEAAAPAPSASPVALTDDPVNVSLREALAEAIEHIESMECSDNSCDPPSDWSHLKAALAEQHPDDVEVDRFAVAMKAKLAKSRAKGRGGWEQCDPADLSRMLREHVEKGDPRDVANFCMFLWALGGEWCGYCWCGARPAAQHHSEPIAWVHEEDSTRVISASQKAIALRDGGASASSVRPYSIAAFEHAAPQPSAKALTDALHYLRMGMENLALNNGVHMVDFRNAERALLAAEQPSEDKRDAERYREFCGSGWPICFLGETYTDKASLDMGIDAAIAKGAE